MNKQIFNFDDPTTEGFQSKVKGQFCVVTPVENIENILENGLKANEDGYVFFFKNQIIKAPYCGIWRLDVDNEVARREHLTDKYAMFIITNYKNAIKGWVDKGVSYGLIRDYQYAVKQDFIKPEYLKYIGTYGYVNQATAEYQKEWGDTIGHNAD